MIESSKLDSLLSLQFLTERLIKRKRSLRLRWAILSSTLMQMKIIS